MGIARSWQKLYLIILKPDRRMKKSKIRSESSFIYKQEMAINTVVCYPNTQ